jgi:RNA 2',3'-cyclic 3'-phosphodiesterase
VPDAVRPNNRLFVALDLPDDLRQALAARGQALERAHGGRAVPAANLHVTLDFLGRVPPERAAVLIEALPGALRWPTFQVRLAGAAQRPARGPARLVAAELEPLAAGDLPERVDGLRRLVADAIGRQEVDGRHWLHVTVLRMGQPTRLAGFDWPGDERVFDISRATLYDSHIAPGRAPRYEPVVRVPLG